MIKYLNVEISRGKRLIPAHVRCASVFIPISHVLEYREFWEDADNDRMYIDEDFTEYKGIFISSLRYAKGEREYYKLLRDGRQNLCIDLVKEYQEREDDPMSINLTYSEKYLNGVSAGRGIRN